MSDDATPAEPLTRRSLWQRLRGGLARLWQASLPGKRALTGASWGAVAGAAFFVALLGTSLRPGFGRLDLPAGILLALSIAFLIGLGAVLAVKLVHIVPRFLGWAGLAALTALTVTFSDPLPTSLAIGVALAIIAAEAVVGGALVLLLGKEQLRPRKRTVLAAAAVAALGANVWLASWLLDRGDTGRLVKPRRPDPVAVAPLDAPDPSQPGTYGVLSLTYGSGTDRWRPEYGSAAKIKTSSVDASPFLKGNEGWQISMRNWYWGFGFEEFPRNGRVYYPDGAGPFPLALIVHGNHHMADFSDPGYEWLGNLLASRGIILVSVDENFLNGSLYGGLEKENDGRGWLLLKHLELWRDWNNEPGNPFEGKVDLDRIAVMGHSRGGEAAAIAASFNSLPRYPDDATVPLGFGFGIRAVVAIAPSDGQYKPAGKPAPVAGVSYLLLQGGHDGDVSIFLGERLYRRLSVAGDGNHFKTLVYSYRSNHGQWNTVWGDQDLGEVESLLLNREALLAPEEQRRLGAVYISAFLEATLKGDRRYVGLFRDGRAARAWLPQDDLYITRFEDNTFRPLADFEEDVDVTTGSASGATLAGEGLALWKEKDLAFREGDGTKQNQVAVLGWKNDPASPGAAASYTLRLAEGGGSPETASLLVFSLADTGEDPPDPKEKNKKVDGEESDAEQKEDQRQRKEREAKAEQDKKEGKEPLDLSIELAGDDGAAVRLPLSRFRALPIPLRSHFTKLKNDKELYGADWEPVLQTFELPLAAFAGVRPGFDPARIREIRFIFDRSPEGVVLLDNVGLAAAASAASVADR